MMMQIIFWKYDDEKDDNDVHDYLDGFENCDDEYDNMDDDYENVGTWPQARQLCERRPSTRRRPLEVPILLRETFIIYFLM